MKLAILIAKLFPNRPKTVLSTIFNDVSEFYPVLGIYDITKLDYYLHNEYGDYEDRGLSMKEFILEKFGEEITNEFKEVFGIK